MIENKKLYSLAESVGLSRMAFYRRAQLEGMTPPLSTEEFQKVALIVAGSPRIDDGQRKAILKLVNSETTTTEKELLPFFRTKESNHKVETTQAQGAIGIETGAAETAVPARVLPETKIEEKGFVRETKSVTSAQVVSPKPETTETDETKISYVEIAGGSIERLDKLATLLMFISLCGISYTIFLMGAGFVQNIYLQMLFGAFSVWAAWRWEHALKAQINTFIHQWVYWEWGGPSGALVSVMLLIALMGPNIYQGIVAGAKLASIVAPIHTQDDGVKINDDLIQEKNAIATTYERTRMVLKQEQETPALADPTVAKFADYEKSERTMAAEKRRAAEARRGDAANYKKKGESANAKWCLHLASEKDKEANQADKKAEEWRMKKEQASAAVYAAYASKFTQLEQQESGDREKVESRYQGILANHSLSEAQLRKESERKNKGMRGIGFIFLTIADIAIILLIGAKVSYFKRTNQVDPSLKPYKVGEKGKLEQFLSGVVGPAWDTVFGVIMQVGYRYQAMAQASLDGAGAVQQLMKERAVVRHQKYQERIAKRIEKMKNKKD